jgi:hypothetical protein
MDELWVFSRPLTGGEVEILRTTNAIPEPGSLALAAASSLLLVRRQRRRD